MMVKYEGDGVGFLTDFLFRVKGVVPGNFSMTNGEPHR